MARLDQQEAEAILQRLKRFDDLAGQLIAIASRLALEIDRLREDLKTATPER